jgi:hypothetical protein
MDKVTLIASSPASEYHEKRAINIVSPAKWQRKKRWNK